MHALSKRGSPAVWCVWFIHSVRSSLCNETLRSPPSIFFALSFVHLACLAAWAVQEPVRRNGENEEKSRISQQICWSPQQYLPAAFRWHRFGGHSGTYIHTYSKKGGSLTTTSQQQHCTASGERYPRQTVSPADRLDGSPRKAIDQYTVEAVRFTGPQCCRGAVSFRNRARASSVAASSSRNRKGCQRGTRVHLYLPTENIHGGSDLKTRPGLYVSQVLSGDAGDVHRIPPTLSSVDRWSLRAWSLETPPRPGTHRLLRRISSTASSSCPFQDMVQDPPSLK